MSAQRIKEMVARFEAQERLKNEILERERQLKRIEKNEEDIQELNKNIHKKYLRTKYKEKTGTAKWYRENSEETANKMYNRAKAKKSKYEKIEKDKAEQAEKELKGLFRPKILKSVESWENLKQKSNKIDQKILRREENRKKKAKKAVDSQTERFNNTNSNTVFSRLQSDLDQRRDRERKRRQLKKFKDKHFKEYTELMEDGVEEEGHNEDN